MSTITPINDNDLISDANEVINTNFNNLNTDKIETSTLDTDTTLAANSDSKIATQKAVKSYVDAGGNPNASETTRGIVEEATDAEVAAGTATGSTGAKLFVTPAKLATRLSSTYQTIVSYKNGSTTYDMSTASGVQNITHGLGVIPKKVSLKMLGQGPTAPDVINNANTVYNGTTQSSIYYATNYLNNTAEAGNTFKFGAHWSGGGALDGYQVGVVTFDATNIIITWTKTGTVSGTAQILWEAQA